MKDLFEGGDSVIKNRIAKLALSNLALMNGRLLNRNKNDLLWRDKGIMKSMVGQEPSTYGFGNPETEGAMLDSLSIPNPL